MLEESKADRILLNKFEFDGREKRYLCELPFEEARIIFMLRSRMFPIKENFEGRWGNECEFCCEAESDIHLFSCTGYRDLLNDVSYEMFMLLEESNEKLSYGAKKLLLVKIRLEKFNISHDV